MVRSLFFAFVISFFISNVVWARDFGVRGPVYEIVEENLLSVMRNRFKSMQQNGEWEVIQKNIKNLAEQKIRTPTPVIGITPAIKRRAWRHDPTWVLSENILDLKERVIAEKGKKINPLDFISLMEVLIFIDARQEKEIQYFEKLLLTEKQPLKLILVNGDVVDLAKSLSRPVYFDQKGRITAQLGIAHTPAVVKQDGSVLVIEEVAL